MSPDDPRLLTLARSLAEVAHAGQVRKGSGAPYFTHVERVAKSAGVLGIRAAIVGYLHDTVEDTWLRWTELNLMFGRVIADDVLTLSRFGGETYAQFIERTITTGSDTALQVKLADLHDNLTDDWMREQGSLRARYLKADVEIRAELIRRGATPLVFTPVHCPINPAKEEAA